MLAIGLDLEALTPVRAPRSRVFREAVLVAYRYSCAVYRVGARLGHALVGVEAAHIKWHASGGPDEVRNGLYLCSLHHKLFDRGTLTLSPDGQQVWVSERTNGNNVWF